MKFKTTFLAFITAALLASCNTERYFYSPSPPNSPVFTNKGDSKIAAYVSGGDVDNSNAGGKNKGYDLQAAYAPGRFWALTASYSSRKERSIYGSGTNNYFDSSVVNYRRKLAEVGAGVFFPLDKKKQFVFSFYTGAGFGDYSFHDYGKDAGGSDYRRSHSSDVKKWYIQPALSFLPSDFFSVSFTARGSFVRFRNIITDYTAAEIQYYELDRLHGKSFGFFEPTLSLRFGVPDVKWARIEGSFTSVSSDEYDDGSRLRTRSINGSIGLSVDLGRIKK